MLFPSCLYNAKTKEEKAFYNKLKDRVRGGINRSAERSTHIGRKAKIEDTYRDRGREGERERGRGTQGTRHHNKEEEGKLPFCIGLSILHCQGLCPGIDSPKKSVINSTTSAVIILFITLTPRAIPFT